jgi:hypothetical protein
MKQLILILLLGFATSSQAQDTIKLPTRVAKQIVKELVSCDSLKAVHELTIQQLMLTENKVSAQDSMITVYKQKSTDYAKEISAEERKTELWQGQFKIVAKKCKKLKTNLTFTRITLTGIIGFLSYLYITK